MANLTSVTLTAGVPTAGTGTVGTIDNVTGTAGAPSVPVLTVQGVASGTPQPISGSVTVTSAPSTAVTNAGTFAVQVSGGSAIPSATAQGSATSGQTGQLQMGAVTTASPTYTTAQTSPLSLDTTGALRVNVTAGGAGGGVVTQATPANLQSTVTPVSNAAWGLGTTTQNSAAATTGTMALAEFNTTPTTITSGNMSPLQMDAAGNLLVNIKAGAGSGGTALADSATFTEGTTSFTPMGGVFKTSQTALTTGQAGSVALSAAREMNTLGKIWDGTTTVPILAASSGPPAATVPAIPVSIRDVNANGRALPGASAPVVLNSMTYKQVAASATNTVLGTTGASGDYLDGLLVIPGAAAAGTVSLKDGTGTAFTVFAGGGTTALPTLAPFFIPLGAISSGGTGGWQVTTGANVTVVGVGNFT